MKKENEKRLDENLEFLHGLINKQGLYDVILDILTCIRMDAHKVSIDRRIYDIQKAEIVFKLERICLTEERFLKRRGR